ncbi:hypothetical protein FIBSPDRAFT_914590 [Athelia psychrophila]|uniref:asparagine synthase (glutamine-hydrolyzing) n=1 Tax=Athelia psychrophila TaxID=1759441 RepID=A0A167XAR2_9AGAM|nr:hypothetical protein FIBSPDRAFT_914590 [Fibularhizoctonia sp. CBS 109695]
MTLVHNTARLIACSKKLRHRAPDWSGCFIGKEGVLHERLAIVGVDTGAQPVASEEGKLILAVNGEIYNFLALRAQVPEYRFKTQSDCEVILPLDIYNLLDGMFSSKCPGAVFFASEVKALVDACDKTISIPPGHVYDSHDQSTSRYFQPTWWDGDSGAPDATIPSTLANLTLIWETLGAAVRKRLISEVPYGVLLSGALDNSLIAAIAARETDKVAQAQYELHKRRLEESTSGPPTTRGGGSEINEEATLAAWPVLRSFCIGLENSPDLLAAREAAGYLGTVHHEYVFTVHEGLEAIPDDVTYHLETYEVTTAPASTPVYLLRKIKVTGIKMVLSGEGSDEILGGYLYFNAAPDRTSFLKECVKRVKNLHPLDSSLRANKSTMPWGLEARVPFLDKAFLEVAMNIDSHEKMFAISEDQDVDQDGHPKMEKTSYILRKAFDCSPNGKIDGVKDAAASLVSDNAFVKREQRWPLDTPDTNEAYYIRELFEGLFPSDTAAKTAVRWIPRGDWGCATDPSGRAVD